MRVHPLDYVVQSRTGLAKFSTYEIAKRHARLNAPASIYRGSQVSRIDQDGGLHLHADNAMPLKRV